MDAAQNAANNATNFGNTAGFLDAAHGDYVGVLAFFSFAFSVIAAVLAIDMYALLRTGQFGRTWRVLIISSVMFALMHALRLAELLNFASFRGVNLSEIVELMFVISLAYAFWLQRRAFGSYKRPSNHHTPLEHEAMGENVDDEVASQGEWARLNGHYESARPNSNSFATPDETPDVPREETTRNAR